MPLVNAMWKRPILRLLPALVLALCVAWPATAFAQISDPTRKLFQAVEVNDMNAVKTAIASGADLGAKNADGKTAADVAVDKGHFIIAHFLLSERNSKATAKRQTDSPAINPLDRLRKPAPLPATSLAKQNQPSQTSRVTPKAVPRQKAPVLPDTATRVTEQLAPVVRRPKPDAGLKTAKLYKYGLPPRRPPAPSRQPDAMTEEIAVAASPGVQVPDGSEPQALLSEAPPTAIKDNRGANLDLPAAPPGEPKKDAGDRTSVADASASSSDPVAAVGNFFKSLVDFVNPLSAPKPAAQKEQPVDSKKSPSPASLPKPKGELAKAQPPTPQTKAEMAEIGDLMEGDQIEAVTGPADDGAETPADANADLADALSPADSDAEAALESLMPTPEEAPVDAPASSASERTLDRIKGLLAENPKEDEFGLPVVDIPTREKVDQADAADTFLDRLAESPEAPGGFLDDRPGPETGPGRQPIDEARDQVPVSDALQARLQRLGDAVTREINVDTDEILRQGRNRTEDPLDQPSEVRASAPRAMTRRRGDKVMDDVLRKDVPLTRQKTPTDRFADRLQRIKEEEQQQEQPMPASAERPAVAAPAAPAAPAPPAPPTEMTEPSVTAQQTDDASGTGEPAILDRMIGFFTGSKSQPSDVKPERPAPEVPDYRGSPSTRPMPEEKPAPEIENLEAFDQVDETKPVQAPGSLEPAFLNRLAGLFSDEEKAQSKGWKAEVRSDNPFPGRGAPGSTAGASPWTTTVEVNVGENRDPIVIQVAQTPVDAPGRPASEAEMAADASNPGAQSRQASGKQTAMAKEPYGDPLRQPDAKAVETKQNAFFGRLTKLFQPKDPVSLERESLLLEPDEKLATARDAMDGGVKVASRTEGEPKNYWPITSLTKADPQLTEPRRRRSLTRTSLTNVTLTLGDSVSLENTFPPGKEGIDPNNECVKKNRGTTLFCIEPIDWPVDLRPSFMIATILYTGSMAIVRYDQGVATRLHTLFRSEDFDKVTAYYQKRFGEPTEILKRSIAPLAKPRQDNPMVSWRSKDESTNAITVIEIRKFDDTRGGFPDTSRGAVMLYFTTSPSIFPQVSSHELMRLKRIGDVTQTEADKTASEAAAGAAQSGEPPAGGAAVSEDELFGTEPVAAAETPSAADNMLNALPDSEPAPLASDQLFGQPQDAAPAAPLFERPEDILNAPDLLAPEPDPLAPAPDLLSPEVNSGEQRLIDSLLGEPVTDEPPDEIIEIPPAKKAGGL